MDERPLRTFLRAASAPVLLSLLAGAALYLALGATTGLFFGAVAVVALITPPLITAHEDRLRQLIVASSAVDGVAIPLLFAVTDEYVTLLDWLRAYVLLAAVAASAWGVTALLVRARALPEVAAALAVVLALAWLAWPVWLSPWLAGRDRLVAALAAAHPLLGLDGALRHLGPPWTERHFMYTKLTVLNQDVFYSLPRGVGPAVLLHAGVALVCLTPYRRIFGRRPGPGGGDEARGLR